MELIILIIIAIFILAYRRNTGHNVYRFIVTQATSVYDRYAPYSFKNVSGKVRALGLDYSLRQYMTQLFLFAGGGFVISYLYFYNIVVSIIYCVIAIFFIPYIAYLRYKRIYSEFIFEQIQVYTTNTIMEFSVTESFVKALEGVYSSGVLENPVLSDVKYMIDLAYENGSIDESISYMNEKYDFYMVKNMHQLFLQITKEGSKDAARGSLENMLLDIDTLVEGVYRDRMDRNSFHRTFIQYGVLLYLFVMLVQYLLGVDSYMKLLDMWTIKLLLHAIIIANSYFLLSGERYYNEDVGVE